MKLKRVESVDEVSLLQLKVINKFFTKVKGEYYVPLHIVYKNMRSYRHDYFGKISSLFNDYVDSGYDEYSEVIVINERRMLIIDKINEFLVTGEMNDVVEDFFDVKNYSLNELRKIIMGWFTSNRHQHLSLISYNNSEQYVDVRLDKKFNLNEYLDVTGSVNVGSLIYYTINALQPDGSLHILTPVFRLMKELKDFVTPLSELDNFHYIKHSELTEFLERVSYDSLEIRELDKLGVSVDNSLLSAGISFNVKDDEFNIVIFKPTKPVSLVSLYRLNNRDDRIEGEYYYTSIPRHCVEYVREVGTILELKVSNVTILAPSKNREAIINWFTLPIEKLNE